MRQTFVALVLLVTAATTALVAQIHLAAQPLEVRALEKQLLGLNAVPLGEALDLATRGVEARLTSSRDVVTRLQAGYADLTDPARRAKRVAEIKAIAPKVKDPEYLDKMMKADAAMAASAARSS